MPGQELPGESVIADLGRSARSARVPLDADPNAAELGTRPRLWLLARRSSTSLEEISYYVSYGPRCSSTADLAWAARSRWHIEDCFAQAKGETGLDHYLVRAWGARRAHVTLSMLALAWLSVTRA